MIHTKAFHRRLPLATAALGMVVGFVDFAAAQPAQTGVHTARQAESGRAVYTRSCAICHRTDLQGNFEAPPLAGTNFLNYWRDRTPRELFEHIKARCPLIGRGAWETRPTTTSSRICFRRTARRLGTRC